MNVETEKNVLQIGKKRIAFPYDIQTILELPKYCVVLLLDNDIPDNNVVAVDYDGNALWNISDIIPFPYAEAYVSLNKVDDALFSVTTYNGMQFVVDTNTNQVVDRMLKK